MKAEVWVGWGAFYKMLYPALVELHQHNCPIKLDSQLVAVIRHLFYLLGVLYSMNSNTPGQELSHYLLLIHCKDPFLRFP